MTESKLNLLKPQKAPATMVTAQCMKWKDMPFASCRHYSSNLTESHYKRGEKKLRHNQNQTSFLSLVVTDLFSFRPKFWKRSLWFRTWSYREAWSVLSPSLLSGGVLAQAYYLIIMYHHTRLSRGALLPFSLTERERGTLWRTIIFPENNALNRASN